MAIATSAVVFDVPGPLRGAVVLPCMLFAPGWAVSRAVRSVTGVVFLDLAVAFMVSLAIYAVLPLALWSLSLPISTASVLVSSDLITVVAALAGFAWAQEGVTMGWSRPDAAALAWFLSAIVLSVCVVIAARELLPWSRPNPYTQLFLAGRWSHVAGPVSTPAGRPVHISVGITNRSGNREALLVTPHLLGGPPWPTRAVMVAAGATDITTIDGPVPADGCLRRLKIMASPITGSGPRTHLTLYLRSGVSSQCRPGRPEP
jgi:hypothetical protein